MDLRADNSRWLFVGDSGNDAAARVPPLMPSSDARVTRAWDVLVVVVANAIVTVGLWLRHGGLDTFGGPGGPLIAAGQLTALIGTYAVLIELLLMSRIAWLERHMGFDRLAVWHRWTGFAAVVLLTGHVVFSTLGFADEGLLVNVGRQVGLVRYAAR